MDSDKTSGSLHLKQMATNPRGASTKMAFNSLSQPLGEDLTDFVLLSPPADSPSCILGRHCHLEICNAVRHAPTLHASLTADVNGSIWTYTGPAEFGLGQLPPIFGQVTAWLERAEGVGGVYVVVVAPCLQAGVLQGEADDGGVVVGTVAYQGVQPEAATATIGHVVHSTLSGTRAATEAHFLMLQRLFALGYRRVAWSCDEHNTASMNAAARLGFFAEGTQRHTGVQQRQEQRVSRSTAYFSILQHEWFGEGGVGETLATWLDDKNFEPSGQQRTRLSDLTAAVRARL